MYKIRPLAPLDETALWDFLYEALYVPAGQPAFPREIMQEPKLRRYVEGWGLADDIGLMALDGNRPIGAIWLRQFSAENPGYGFVNDRTPEMSIALRFGYRGQGLGRALMSQLFEFVQDRYAAISLSVSLENPARRLYERLGFEVVKSAGDSMIMVKYLSQRAAADKA